MLFIHEIWLLLWQFLYIMMCIILICHVAVFGKLWELEWAFKAKKSTVENRYKLLIFPSGLSSEDPFSTRIIYILTCVMLTHLNCISHSRKMFCWQKCNRKLYSIIFAKAICIQFTFRVQTLFFVLRISYYTYRTLQFNKMVHKESKKHELNWNKYQRSRFH